MHHAGQAQGIANTTLQRGDIVLLRSAASNYFCSILEREGAPHEIETDGKLESYKKKAFPIQTTGMSYKDGTNWLFVHRRLKFCVVLYILRQQVIGEEVFICNARPIVRLDFISRRSGIRVESLVESQAG